MTNTELLNEVIRKRGVKIGFLAEQLGITRQAFAKKRDNHSNFTAAEIKTLCEVLGITSLREKDAIFFA
jgi:DNA-binding Xre family transcriptional regulator